MPCIVSKVGSGKLFASECATGGKLSKEQRVCGTKRDRSQSFCSRNLQFERLCYSMPRGANRVLQKIRQRATIFDGLLDQAGSFACPILVNGVVN
jgi:hypothetical protein